MSKVLEFHSEGYNCAEAVLKAINEEKGLNIPVALGTPFGAGMSTGNTCGAVVSSMMVIGAIKGRETNEEKNETRVEGKELINKIIEKYGTIKCVELKKKGISCREIIEFSYNTVKEIL